jgi:hypothetical protein
MRNLAALALTAPECKADCPPDVHGSTATHTINLRTGAMT